MKYIILNYHTYSILEIIDTDKFIEVDRRLNKLNKKYNNELIVLSLSTYNKTIKNFISKLKSINKISTL